VLRCTFYTFFPVEKLGCILNLRNVHLSNFVPKTHVQKLDASQIQGCLTFRVIRYFVLRGLRTFCTGVSEAAQKSVKLLLFPLRYTLSYIPLKTFNPSIHTSVVSYWWKTLWVSRYARGNGDWIAPGSPAIKGTHLHGTKYSETYTHIRHWQSSCFWAIACLRRFCQICLELDNPVFNSLDFFTERSSERAFDLWSELTFVNCRFHFSTWRYLCWNKVGLHTEVCINNASLTSK
jgi:hypothetical protein